MQSGDISLVQTFIAFGADVNTLNNNGESPRHLAATDRKIAVGEILYALHIIGANRCSVPMHSCNDGCTVNGQFNGIPPENCAFSKTTETCMIFHHFYLICSKLSYTLCDLLTGREIMHDLS